MWDALEHILFFVNLVILFSSISFILHSFVDKWVPTVIDVANKSTNRYLIPIQNSLLRFYIAAMIVSYPLFAFLFLKITKRVQICPEIHTIRSRKTIIYLSLFSSSVMIIGTIISAVYSFISGAITLNYILHFCIAFIINFGIFIYFLHLVNVDKKAYA
jgi:hypothetical protein